MVKVILDHRKCVPLYTCTQVNAAIADEDESSRTVTASNQTFVLGHHLTTTEKGELPRRSPSPPSTYAGATTVAQTVMEMSKFQKSVTITNLARKVPLWSTVWRESSATKACDFGMASTQKKIQLLRPPWLQTVHEAFQPLGKFVISNIIVLERMLECSVDRTYCLINVT